ncbi:hypothetical protein A3SI_05749 [Nitritalea halalkaliphila LW7]|uniref:HTTM domain-containing protein n=1 Tax=Nitritalea halalkaliphila LW7 TaxID=1189621 RepID=I5C767_9BACT|nr:hypothetical protein [Nitritalea halalkaliphila]EIM77669.1 hypothetical protein A3SI_05749 [Nitritalea halalkaliphila LW7]
MYGGVRAWLGLSESKRLPVELLFRVALALQCVGLYFYFRAGSSLEAYLFLDRGWEQAQSRQVDVVLAYLHLGVAIFWLLRPTVVLAVILGCLQVLVTYMTWYQGGAHFTEWAFFTQAIRMLSYPAFVFWVWGYPKVSAWVLRVGLGLTFFSHGLEALYQHPHFIDYLIGTARQFGFRLREAQAVQLLRIIGVVDVLVAVWVLVRPWRGVLFWMAFWGLLTAFSRLTELGLAQYPQVLLRSLNFLGPLLLWLLTFHFRSSEGDAKLSAGD